MLLDDVVCFQRLDGRTTKNGVQLVALLDRSVALLDRRRGAHCGTWHRRVVELGPAPHCHTERARGTANLRTKVGCFKYETNLLRVTIFLNTPATLDQLSKANNTSPHATARHRTVHNAWHRAFGLSLLHPERGSHTSHYFTLHLTPHGSGAPAPCNGRAPPRAAPPPWPRRRPRRRRAAWQAAGTARLASPQWRRRPRSCRRAASQCRSA